MNNIKLKEIVYSMLIILLTILIGFVIMFKLFYNSNANSDAISNFNSNLVDTGWSKVSYKYSNKGNTMYVDEKIKNIYFYVMDSIIKMCDSIEENNCSEYKYYINDEKLKIYISDSSFVEYLYEYRSDSELLLTEQGNGYVREIIYKRVVG